MIIEVVLFSWEEKRNFISKKITCFRIWTTFYFVKKNYFVRNFAGGQFHGFTAFLENHITLFPRNLDNALNHEIQFHKCSFT